MSRRHRAGRASAQQKGRRGRFQLCSRGLKRRFRDHREAVSALQAARNVREAQLRTGDKVIRRRECRSYECPSCRGWHLTSQP